MSVEDNSYVEADCAIIHKTRDRFGELSNMCSGFPIEYDNRDFFSTEALYQCCRYPGRPDLQEPINVKNAMVAKMKSKPPRSFTRPDWYDLRVNIMENCLRLKVEQHFSRISDVIALTGDMPIVEKSRNDSFWGAIPDGTGRLIGTNALGLLWMLIREEIRNGHFHCSVNLNL